MEKNSNDPRTSSRTKSSKTQTKTDKQKHTGQSFHVIPLLCTTDCPLPRLWFTFCHSLGNLQYLRICRGTQARLDIWLADDVILLLSPGRYPEIGASTDKIRKKRAVHVFQERPVQYHMGFLHSIHLLHVLFLCAIAMVSSRTTVTAEVFSWRDFSAPAFRWSASSRWDTTTFWVFCTFNGVTKGLFRRSGPTWTRKHVFIIYQVDSYWMGKQSWIWKNKNTTDLEGLTKGAHHY